MEAIKSFTSLEQSRKLAGILPIESADMNYWCGTQIRIGGHRTMDKDLDVPCWSLSALLSVLPFPVLYMEMLGGMILWCCECHFMETDEMVKIEHCNDPVDACAAMIEKLHELNLL